MNMHSVQGETSQNSLKYVHILKFEHIFKEYNSHKTLKDLSFHWLIILTLNLNTVLTHIACYIGQRGKNWVSVYSLMATHSSTLAWKIPWTEERGRLQSMGSERVGHNWATSLTHCYVLRVCAQLLSQRVFCDPLGYSPPGSSVDGIFQARIL